MKEVIINRIKYTVFLCLILQSIIIVVFMSLQIWFDNLFNSTNAYYIYTILCQNFIFMYYFAYHSIGHSYFVEFIAFIVLSLFSSGLVMAYFFLRRYGEFNTFITSMGIFSTILLFIANGLYLYFANSIFVIFNKKILEKIGKRKDFYDMYTWQRFTYSLMKLDFELLLLYFVTMAFFSHKYIFLNFFDFLLAAASFFFFRYLKKGIKYENKRIFKGIISSRVFVEGYIFARIIFFLFVERNWYHDKFDTLRLYIVSFVALDFILMTMTIYSSMKCFFMFGKGFRRAFEELDMAFV